MEQKVIRKKNGEYVFRKDIEKIFEHNGFTISSIEKLNFDYQVEINGKNPYYEDWYEVFTFNGYLDDLQTNILNLYECFDVDEDVKLWIDSAGKNGVPHARGLVENAEYKDNKLKELNEEINLL